MTKYNLHELFGPDVGPHSKAHKPITGKSAVFDQYVEEAVREIQELVRAAAAGQASDSIELNDFGAERKRARNEENARRARDALKRRTLETNNKRKITIT